MSVYFVKAVRTGFIKIGKSSAPDKRLMALQTSNGEDLSLLFTVPGDRKEERAFHARFHESHERGEWFREDGKLLEYLKARGKDTAGLLARAAKLSANVLRRGFSRNSERLDDLYKVGLEDNQIYIKGRGAESLEECLWSFRGRPGELVLPMSLVAFGDKKAEIRDAMDEIERGNIRVRDLSHPEDDTHVKLLSRGYKSVSMNSFHTSRGKAKRYGAFGGTAKGNAERKRRSALVADHIVKAMIAHPKLSIRDVAGITGISRNVLSKQYR